VIEKKRLGGLRAEWPSAVVTASPSLNEIRSNSDADGQENETRGTLSRNDGVFEIRELLSADSRQDMQMMKHVGRQNIRVGLLNSDVKSVFWLA